MKYVLVGSYNNGRRPNAEILASSDDLSELAKIKALVNKATKEAAFGYSDELSKKQLRMVTKLSEAIDMFDEETDYYEEVDITGIYEVKEVGDSK